jgi:hypothetical protein
MIKTNKGAKELRQSRYGKHCWCANSRNCYGKHGVGFGRQSFQWRYPYATFGAVRSRPSGSDLVFTIVLFAVRLFSSVADWRPSR